MSAAPASPASSSPLTPGERIEGALARSLFRLPPAAIARLAGSPVEIDGQRLAPGVQLGIWLLALNPAPPLWRSSPSANRRRTRVQSAQFAGAPIPIGPVRDLRLPGGDGPIAARLYAPAAGPTGLPLLVYFHGGGWVVGDVGTHDQLCRLLARDARVRVLSIDYRLAPEHPFPAALDDAMAAYAWATDNAVELGADPARVAIGGDSAGGNLAAVVCAQRREAGLAQPALQALLYPVCDRTVKRRSWRLFARDLYLEEPGMDWYWDQYLAGGGDPADPRISPLCAERFDGLAPALVAVAGFDILRDEGIAYARALEAAGVRTVLQIERGMFHGFANVASLGHGAGIAMRGVCDHIAEALHPTVPGTLARALPGP